MVWKRREYGYRKTLKDRLADAAWEFNPAWLLGGAVVAMVGCVAAEQFDRDSYTATVTDKAVMRKTKSSDTYLIYTQLQNGETRVFENDDAWFYGKFNSSDWYQKIKVGETYEFDTIGWRIPLFSTYENIVDFKKVEKEKK
jgi:hypothetical protein